MQIASISYNLSYIYIYIVKTVLKISPKRRETPPHMGQRGGFTEKRRETQDFTPFSCRFPPFSFDSAAKHRNFKRFHRVTEENRAFSADFMQFAAVSSVPGRVLRVLSAVGKTPEKDGARPFHLLKSQNHPPVSRRPRGSGGRATGFRRPAAGAAQDSPRKILRGSSFSSAPLALCEVCLIIGKMLQNCSKTRVI